jgi:murein L,D-transpeptidase YcbB/YkuD
VLVNAAFTLQAVERGNLALTSNVVGASRRAPRRGVGADRRSEFLSDLDGAGEHRQSRSDSKLQKDPSYFVNEHFSVLQGRIGRSAQHRLDEARGGELPLCAGPGSFNALGVVRINMPNRHSVYMHDTPLKQLFSQSARAFSSGCVRVQKVAELVAWLLGVQGGWTLAKVEAQIDSGKKLDVELAQPVPVHFVYVTAFASGNGVAQFRPDIYGRDAPGADDSEGQSAVVAQQRSAITP